MMLRRLSILLPALAIVFLTQSCKDTSDLLSPVEPQFAKGGKPGAPGDEDPPAEVVDPVLKEFWVYQDEDQCPGGSIVHVVVEGTFQSLGVGFTHDHFFNGVDDDDSPYETHYEFGFGGGEDPPTEFSEDGTQGHIDVCWTGQMTVDYENGEILNTSWFSDYPATSVGGTGADPFVIGVSAFIGQDGRYFHSKSFRIEGVVEDGARLGTEEESVTSTWHGGQAFLGVTSYAIHQGNTPPGYLFFQDLSLSDVACRITTKTEGRGKNKTQVSMATVSAQVTIGYGSAASAGTTYDYNQNFWGEGHLRLVTADGETLSERMLTPQKSGTYPLSRQLDLGTDWSGQEITLEFIADFLNAVGGDSDIWPTAHFSELYTCVYDPGSNTMFTSAGYGPAPGVEPGDAWNALTNVSTTRDDGLFPVAHSNTETVTCR